MAKHGVNNPKRKAVDDHMLEVAVCLLAGLSEAWIAERYGLDLVYVREAVARWGLPYGGIRTRDLGQAVQDLENIKVMVGEKVYQLSWDAARAVVGRSYRTGEFEELARLRRVARANRVRELRKDRRRKLLYRRALG